MTDDIITISAGAPASDLTPGVYEVTLVDISEPRTIYPQSGPNAGKEVQLRDWTFALEDGTEVTGSASTASGPKSKTFAWLTALLGGTPPAVGKSYPKSQLVGREALATIAIDEGGWTKIANLSARPKARAAAPVATPAPSARRPQAVAVDDSLPLLTSVTAMPSPRPSSEDRIRAALWFAEHGFGVFSVWSTDPDGTCRCVKGRACENAGKHPVPGIGFKAATTDPARIRTMLSIPSDPNYGMLPPEGVFALDVDGDGVARLARLEAEHGPLPPTLRTATAHGQHIFLRWPDGLPRPIGQLFGYVTRWGSGRDAGYVVGPRSVHASGAVYAPATGTLTVAELPEAWARAALAAPPTTDVATITITGGYVLPERVPAGAARYPEIVRYTAHLYDTSRLTVAEMWPLVRDVLGPRFADPLTPEQLRDRFDRAVAKMEERLGERRHVPPAPADPATFPQPENRGQATLSDLGEVEYVEDLIRPGRIVVWAAEEGSGKSFAVSGELAIRVAAAGGTFAGTWPVIQRGRVLVLSEMHPDDDYAREETILESLGLDRRALDGTYFRLDLMRAAGGKPALTVPEWRDWITGWLEEHEAILMVIDTATGATQVDPWGHAIQEVYANLRLMLSRYPYLAVILIVHVRKPAGRGAGGRQLSVL